MFLPLIFRGDRLRALVVGGGSVALRKVKDLIDSRAEIHGISPGCHPDLERLIEKHDLHWKHRSFRHGDTSGYNLVVVATDNPVLNREISEEAQAAGIPVNVVDQPDLCTVYFPAVIRRNRLILAVSTGGDAPFFASELRKHLETQLTEEWLLKAQWAGSFREYVFKHIGDQDRRQALFSRFMELQYEQLVSWKADDPPFNLWKSWFDRDG